MRRREHSINWRTTSVLIVLCLMVLGQWCALDAEHQQHRANEHCCLLCHIGPQATLAAVVPVFQAPVLSSFWREPPAEATAPRQAFVLHSSSRAPPAGSYS